MTFLEVLRQAYRRASTGWLYMCLHEWFAHKGIPDTPDNRGTLIRMIAENHVPGWRGFVLIYPDGSGLVFPYHPDDRPPPGPVAQTRSPR